MDLFTTYSVKIKKYNQIFTKTVSIYRDAVDFFIDVCLNEWTNINALSNNHKRLRFMEILCHRTKNNPNPVYDFDAKFYKMPCYMRRAAIVEALGKVSSYKSNLDNWYNTDAKTRGREPSSPKAGYVYPAMYRTVMYKLSGDYKAQLKIYIRNTWDWITVEFKKSDMDYINRHCGERKKCAPTLQKRGKEWFLDFPFEETISLNDVEITGQTIVAVDLGINTAATISVMQSDGTILGRHFCKLPKEQDSLKHRINRIKKAQQHGNYKTPILWGKVKGINHDIATKTANFIMDISVRYQANTIVFEHLERKGKIRGSKKQRLHLWKIQKVQSIVANKAHRLGMRISRVSAWGTSRLAYDGSGPVLRGKSGGFKTYELCQFQTGKIYNCDLSASYNIGARYFVRELIKSLDARTRLGIEAKVPQSAKRSTCTFSTLISLNAELISLAT